MRDDGGEADRTLFAVYDTVDKRLGFAAEQRGHRIRI
jgi:hypothetical protein